MVLDVIDPFVQVARVEQVLYFGPVGRGRDADAQEVGRRAVYGFDEAVGPGQRVAESQHRPAGRVLAERQGRVTAADGHHVGGGVAGPLADPREQQNRDIVDLLFDRRVRVGVCQDDVVGGDVPGVERDAVEAITVFADHLGPQVFDADTQILGVLRVDGKGDPDVLGVRHDRSLAGAGKSVAG